MRKMFAGMLVVLILFFACAKDSNGNSSGKAAAQKQTSQTSEETEIKLTGELNAKQSFEVDLAPFGKVKYASCEDFDNNPPRVNFYLLKGQQGVYEFPDFHGNQNWAFSEMVAVTFSDVNADTLKDVIVMANYISGMGRSGTVPFKVIGVYLNEKNSFTHPEELTEILNNSENFEKLNTLKAVEIFLKEYFK